MFRIHLFFYSTNTKYRYVLDTVLGTRNVTNETPEDHQSHN
jgi:hypothetical protein